MDIVIAVQHRFGHVSCDAVQAIATGLGVHPVDMVRGEGWCLSCSWTVPLQERFAACPLCRNAPVRMTTGDELRVAELEVE